MTRRTPTPRNENAFYTELTRPKKRLRSGETQAICGPDPDAVVRFLHELERIYEHSSRGPIARVLGLDVAADTGVRTATRSHEQLALDIARHKSALDRPDT
jgi:hypothetical protein